VVLAKTFAGFVQRKNHFEQKLLVLCLKLSLLFSHFCAFAEEKTFNGTLKSSTTLKWKTIVVAFGKMPLNEPLKNVQQFAGAPHGHPLGQESQQQIAGLQTIFS
jgi:hypothetical protein